MSHPKFCYGKYANSEKFVRGCAACIYASRCVPSREDLTAPVVPPVDYELPKTEPARSKYHREIKPGVWVDCYDVLMAWNVTNPALQHLLKKVLAPGERGHKTKAQDMQDIVDSAIRAKELEGE